MNNVRCTLLIVNLHCSFSLFFSKLNAAHSSYLDIFFFNTDSETYLEDNSLLSLRRSTSASATSSRTT